jgi:hypothetical protein
VNSRSFPFPFHENSVTTLAYIAKIQKLAKGREIPVSAMSAAAAKPL